MVGRDEHEPFSSGSDKTPLAGQVAVITGAASGIGKATALGLSGYGAAVALVDIAEKGLLQTEDEIVREGGKAKTFGFDLANVEAIEGLIDQVVEHFGRVDILVNGSGVSDLSGVIDGTLENWERTFRINATAPFLLMKAVGTYLRSQGTGGRIVNVSSSSAFRTRGAGAAYGSSKGALRTLSLIAAGEFGDIDVNVNAVVPGLTRTGMVTPVLDEEAIHSAVTGGPMANVFGRISEPEDVSAVIVFLCLPESRQISGQAIHVSAGAVV
jgi:NAD(P)-dependent dehydrogenase (short-subunit alcohol dehydrogenase family)